MNTLKRKLTAILLTFAMLFSLMPALPQAAEAAPEEPNGHYTGDGMIEFKIGEPQIFELLYLYDSSAVISEDTEIDGVQINWIEKFGYLDSTSLGWFVNFEGNSDYWQYSFSNSTGKEIPSNVEGITIKYVNPDKSEHEITIPADNLRFNYDSDPATHEYNISSTNDTVHVVMFYDKQDGAQHFTPYAVRIVEDGVSLGVEMPANPDYGVGTYYRFINWDTYSRDGSTHQPFLSTTIVNDDYTVFARKAGTEYSGTEIHVVNSIGTSQNELLDLVAKLYNEKNGTQITANSINTEKDFSICIYDKDGNYTSTDAPANGWRTSGDVGYYNVVNSETAWNDHLSQDNLDYIRVSFEFNDGTAATPVDIPIGEYADQLSVYMASNETIIELIVNQPGEVEPAPGGEDPDPEPPEAPTYEDMKEPVVNGAVKIDCINPLVQHEDPTYGLIEGSYTLPADGVVGDETNGFTYTITVSPDKYVETYNTNTHSSHTLVDGQSAKTITYKYDNGDWVVADTTALPLVYEVNCDATPDQYITGFDKELVSTAEAAEAAVGTSEGYAFPNGQGIVLVPNGGEVTLLYSITVQGKPGTAFHVSDPGATLVKEDAHVEDRGNGEFYGHLSVNDSMTTFTFYVAKTFKAADITDGKLTNHAKIEIDKEDGEEGTIDPDVDPDVDEVVNAEEEPALPTEEWLEENFDVELDCTSNVGHENQTYDLVYKDGMLGTLTRDDAGNYTITMTVAGEDYLDQFKVDSENVAHQVVGDPTKTITLKYENDGWTADSSLIEFDVKCSGTGDYDINGFTKDLIAGNSEKEVAQNDGVEVKNYTIPAENESVVIPYNGEVTLLYKLTVTGNGQEEVNFVVTDDGAEFVKAVGDAEIVFNAEEDTFTGIVPADKSVSFYVSKTFDADDIIDGKLVNEALIAGTGEDEDASVDPGIDDIEEEVGGEEGEPAGTVTITPADLTIYEGGEGGYDAVVNEDGNQVEAAESTSLPHPLFKITVPDGSSIDPETLTFTNGSNVWEVVHDGDNLYHFEVAEEGMTPVRVTYTNAAGKVVTSDEFTPEENSYAEYTIRLYPGNNADDFSNVTAIADDGARYAINAENQTGKLTVRAVDGTQEESVSAIVTNENADSVEKVDAGEAVAVEPENGTTYSLNDTEVKVDENDSKPSLLFDTIIDDEVNRTEMLEDKVDEALGGADADRDYEIKYIDLVDANNGNAWIASENGTDILWGYPEGTDIDTEFQILHFKELHRDGETTGFDPEELGAIDVNDESQLEHVTITNTDEGILFHVDKANFSPFALTWETDNGGSDTPGGDTPGGDDPWYPPYNPGDDDKPSGLNTEDHFSYVVGYEDGMVKPQRSITRAEVATIFYRLLEDDVRDDYDTTRNNFSDVTSDSWYNQTVSTLASMGILKGYEDGTFRPNASITRAEFAAIATRFFEETGATYEPGTFTDVTGDEWFAGAIMDAVNLGLIGGYEDGTVRPNNNITRAEACAIVNRTLGRVPDADHLLPADEMTTWPDNPSSAWFYADMQEATNGHEYEWITEDGNKIEEWTDILDKDWNDR